MVALPDKFQTSLSYGSSEEDEFRVDRKQLGDGYSLRVINGINPIVETLKLNWNNLTTADATELRDFWRDRKGVEAVELTPPDSDTEISVISISKFTKRYVAYNQRSCSITVERIYG